MLIKYLFIISNKLVDEKDSRACTPLAYSSEQLKNQKKIKRSGYALYSTNYKMLMVEFMSYPIAELAEIKPLPANVIPAKTRIQEIQSLLDAGSSPA